ncbi:hypothetical protein HELRODRAFT_163373 [Helobdella robusta]|uniref:Uncharacterized protein n=1 Tax=Helobdella robusta TaxID=6412 RepID=T1ETZ0_HELRO|nr:hypothetical protein HELRODRAFT_163373 [Helobdella robusta]ESN96322.1 hypothetical protein HELRODRAFT_163373 [Helobdella robusta]
MSLTFSKRSHQQFQHWLVRFSLIRDSHGCVNVKGFSIFLRKCPTTLQIAITLPLNVKNYCDISTNKTFIFNVGREDLCHNIVKDFEYDLRIIVLTYKRSASLLKLLQSLNALETDGDSVLLEIWIDRSIDGHIDSETLISARSFLWRNGPVHIYLQSKHVGIIGQWIYSWVPKKYKFNKSKISKMYPYEIGLILEDDISIAPYSYKWLKAAKKFYNSTNYIAGITFQSESLINAESGRDFNPLPSLTGPSFFYRLIGSWGFAPEPRVWLKFQRWFKTKTLKHPYVPKILMTRWYQYFESINTTDTMWTMWFIYYCHYHRLVTLYSNIFKPTNKTFRSNKIPRINQVACLALNRKEPGLHYSKPVKPNTNCLNWYWRPEYTDFKKDTILFGYNGKPTKIELL